MKLHIKGSYLGLKKTIPKLGYIYMFMKMASAHTITYKTQLRTVWNLQLRNLEFQLTRGMKNIVNDYIFRLAEYQKRSFLIQKNLFSNSAR